MSLFFLQQGKSQNVNRRTWKCKKLDAPMRRVAMSEFDSAYERHQLTGDCGYGFDLAADIEQAKAVGGRGNAAHAFLGTAIRCLLQDLADPASQLLRKVNEWVTASLVESEVPKRSLHDERYSGDGEAALRYRTLALCNWLLCEQHDADSFGRFVELEDRALATSELGRNKSHVSLILTTYLDAGAFARVLELFASSTGQSEPKSLGSIRKESQMCYVLSRHRLHQQYNHTEVTSAVGKFLDRNADEWLSEGHFVRAAEWMKIVYWHGMEAGTSARAALLKCYQHLPSRNRESTADQ